MSSTYHIPFPTNYLSLNTPVKKSTTNTTPLTPPEATSHSFLSNIHTPSDRKSSVSSTTSSENTSSPTKEAAPAGAFLPLNGKYKAPAGAFRPLPASPFLSNRADELRRGSV